MTGHPTAILIFARSSGEDVRQKAIAGGEEFFDTLNAHTLKAVKAASLPYFHLTEKEQKGNTFGERLCHALEAVYQKGYVNVIAIGNDTPHLNASLLLEGGKALAAGKPVIGPSADGGIYLLGLHKALFNAEALENLPWQSSRLHQALRGMILECGATAHRLSTLFDIDNTRDIRWLVARFRQIPLVILNSIIALFKVSGSACGALLTAVKPPGLPRVQNRGSP